MGVFLIRGEGFARMSRDWDGGASDCGKFHGVCYGERQMTKRCRVWFRLGQSAAG